MECPTFLLLGELLLQTEYMEFLRIGVCLSSGHISAVMKPAHMHEILISTARTVKDPQI